MTERAIDQRTLANENSERDFTSRGYVVRPLLDAGEIQALQALHDELFPVVPLDFHSTFLVATADQKLRVLSGVREVIGAKVSALLPGYRIRSATFITKRPNSQRGLLPFHRDAWLTDHVRVPAPSIWIPLVDVGPGNACMRVVPCSHRLFPDPYPVNAGAATDSVDEQFVRDVPMRAGTALVYDTRLVHGTGENLADRLRVAINVVMVREGHEPQLYFWDDRPPGRIQVFEVSESFLCQYRFGSRPEEPYPRGVRLVDTIDNPTTAWGRIDSAALRRLQADAGIGN